MSDEKIVKQIDDLLNAEDGIKKIEDLFREFNPFIVLKCADHEIRHSNVLGWLLDPKQNHKLDDEVLKPFIKMLSDEGNDIRGFYIDGSPREDILVYRERYIEGNRFDLLIESQKGKAAIIIENKIYSDEGKEQLKAYYELAKEEFKEYTLIFVYLTVEGDQPSDKNWIRMDYSKILAIIEKAVKQKHNQADENILFFIDQYISTIRRHVMNDSEIQKICKDVYYKHKEALDEIFKYNQQDHCLEILTLIKKIIQDKYSDSLLPVVGRKRYIGFTTKSLDAIVKKKGINRDFGEAGHMLLYFFEIPQGSNDLFFNLYIGEGDDEYREKLYVIAKGNKKLFAKVSKENIIKGAALIFQKVVLKDQDYQELKRENEDGDLFEMEIKNRIDMKLPELLESVHMIDEYFTNSMRAGPHT